MTTATASTKRSWWRRLSKTLLDSEASLFKSTVVGRAKSPERLRGQLGTRANTGRRGTFHIWRCAFPNWAGRSSLSRLRAQSALPASPCPQLFRRVRTK